MVAKNTPSAAPAAPAPSCAELIADRNTKIQDALNARDAEVSRLQSLILQANAEQERTTAVLEAAHVEEIEQRTREIQRTTHDALLPLVRDSWASPNRGTTTQIAAIYRAANAESSRLTGSPLSEWTLAHAIASLSVEQHPELLEVWVRPDTFAGGLLPGIADAAYGVHKLMVNGGDVIALHDAILALEVAMSRKTSGVHLYGAPADAHERFDLIRFGGSRGAVQAALSALDKERARVESEQAHREVVAHMHEQDALRAASRGILHRAVDTITGLLPA